MEWKADPLVREELERKQAAYIRQAIEMSRRAGSNRGVTAVPVTHIINIAQPDESDEKVTAATRAAVTEAEKAEKSTKSAEVATTPDKEKSQPIAKPLKIEPEKPEKAESEAINAEIADDDAYDTDEGFELTGTRYEPPEPEVVKEYPPEQERSRPEEGLELFSVQESDDLIDRSYTAPEEENQAAQMSNDNEKNAEKPTAKANPCSAG